MDWMWSGLHLSDGTHIHAVAPGKFMPDGTLQGPVGIGYVQKDGVVTTEITKCITEQGNMSILLIA